MNKSLELHKQELEQLKLAQKIKLDAQLNQTKQEFGTTAKMALIGGAATYATFKILGYVLNRKKRKRRREEQQIVYVQQPNTVSVPSGKTIWQTMKASALAALLPILTNFAKTAGTKAAEKYAESVFEKFKYKFRLDELINKLTKS